MRHQAAPTTRLSILQPTTADTYNAYFRIHDGDTCGSSNQSAVFTLSNAVTVTAPDFTASKSNDVSDNVTLGNSFTWTIPVANTGNAVASFSNGSTILTDNLPSGPTYGAPSVSGQSGITGTINCGTITSNNLNCTASGAVSIASTTGSFYVSFTVTPNAAGTLANPRTGSGSPKCQADPSGNITESNETNNNCTDSVTVVTPKPDLTATKTNNVSGNATVSVPFTWTIRIANSGNVVASFSNGQEILKDERTSTGVTSYGSPSALAGGGATGTVSCAQSGSPISRDLTCTANGTVTIPVAGYFDISYAATPSAVGTLTNPRSSSNCSTDRNGVLTETNEGNNTCSDSVTVAQYIAPNPQLGQSCGMDMVLVLDSSDSMSTADITTVKNSANTLVNALMPGTPTRIGVIDFDTNVVSFLNPTATKASVISAINSIGHTGSTEYTNWEAAIKKVDDMVGAGALVVIITDGNPTTSNGPLSDLDDAIVAANTLKGSGTRILAIGINSSGTQGGLDLDNLKAITGQQAITVPPGTITNINNVDVVMGDISQLGTALVNLTTALCGGTITVTKLVDTDGNSATTNDQSFASGWTFNIGGTIKTTQANGKTDAVTQNAGTYVVTETVQPGYTLLDASCSGAVTNGNRSGDSINGIQISNTSIVSCTFINSQVGHIIVDKVTDPSQDPQSFTFTPSWGSPFNLTDSATPVDGGPIAGGTYSVSEAATPGWSLTAATCSDQSSPSSISLQAGETVTCTFTNTKLILNLSVTKSDSPDPVYAGEKITYTLDWSITGNTPANNLKLVEEVVAPFEFIPADNPGWYSSSAGEYSYDLGSPTPPASGSVTLILKVGAGFAGASVTNTIVLAAQDPANPTGNALTASGNQDTAVLHYGSISGQKFYDYNGNGVKGGQEAGLSGWTIYLDANGNDSFDQGEQATTTDTDGNYTFAGLLLGTYSVREILQTGWEQIAPQGGEFNIQIASGTNSQGNDFANRELGRVTVTKYLDRNANGNQDSGDETLSGWNVTLGQYTQVTESGQTTFADLVPGAYALSEPAIPEGWFQSNISCDEERGIDNDNDHQVQVNPGDEINCLIGNYQKGKFTGVKWNDENANGQNDTEPVLPGWTIFIDENRNGLLDNEEQSVQTGQGGSYELGNLTPGTYRVCEVNQTGWIQTHPLNDINNCHEATISSGDNIQNTVFGNQEIKLGLVLAKSNDKSGGTSAGDTVTFALNLTNTSNQEIHNLKITDVLPGGFTYVAGSTVINGSPAPDPIVSGGVLTWDIGTLAPGASVTISYQATIPSDTAAGTYTNLATCKGKGYSTLREILLDTVECDPAASSTVTIGASNSYGGSVGAAVLGTATVLPATGGNMTILLLAFAALVAGSILKLSGYLLAGGTKKGKKHGKN